jgi:hypothetical protein
LSHSWIMAKLFVRPGARTVENVYAKPEHQRIVQRWFYEFFAAAQLDLLDELVAPGLVVRDPGDRTGTVDRAGFRAWLEWYRASFTDQRWTIHEAVVRYSGQTTYRGGFFDLPARSEPVREVGVLIFRIADGRVQELWSGISDLDLIFSLGGKVVPATEEIERSES